MTNELFEQFGLSVEGKTKVGKYDAFTYQNILYTMVLVGNLEQDEIVELNQLSQFMIEKGDTGVASFVPTRQGSFIATVQNKKVLLLRSPYYSYSKHIRTGKELAKFHQKGRSFPYQITKCVRIGQWKFLWEKRLDQMELFWKDRVHNHPANSFEKLFVESFPYYLGVTENAIQYLVDTELDDEPKFTDSATVCHHRFTSETWNGSKLVKLPTEWVFDHCSRDLAEWIRHYYFANNKMEQATLRQFVTDYERATPLSTFSWRLLYARLLFPIHYFECVEGYFTSQTDLDRQAYEKKLFRIIEDSNDYEQFLRTFFYKAGVNVQTYGIPEVGWIQHL